VDRDLWTRQGDEGDPRNQPTQNRESANQVGVASPTPRSLFSTGSELVGTTK
jgi:hypothetical protein